MFEMLEPILMKATYKKEETEDILHDYEIKILLADNSSQTLRYWITFKRFENEKAEVYALDTDTSNAMNTFLDIIDQP